MARLFVMLCMAMALLLSAGIIQAQVPEVPDAVCAGGFTASGEYIPKEQGGCCQGAECCQYEAFKNNAGCSAATGGQTTGSTGQTTGTPTNLTGTIESENSSFRIFHADGTIAPPGDNNLRAGDTLRVAKGDVALKLSDGTRLHVYSGTSVTMKEDSYTVRGLAWVTMPDGHMYKTGRGTILTLMKNLAPVLLDGDLKLAERMSKSWFNFYILTPNAVIAPRGTEFILEQNENITTLYLHEGLVDVTPIVGGVNRTDLKKTVEAGQLAVVDARGVVNITQLTQEQWDARNSLFENSTQEAGSAQDEIQDAYIASTAALQKAASAAASSGGAKPAACPLSMFALSVVALFAVLAARRG